METNTFLTVWMNLSRVPSQYHRIGPNRSIWLGRFRSDGKLLVFSQNGIVSKLKYRSKNLWQHAKKILMCRSIKVTFGSLGDMRSEIITLNEDSICRINSSDPVEIVEDWRNVTFKKLAISKTHYHWHAQCIFCKPLCFWQCFYVQPVQSQRHCL